MSFFQLAAALNVTEWKSEYPMDYYAYDSLGPWTNNHAANRQAPTPRNRRPHVNIEVQS